ncbi:MAG: DUF4193 family protein [Acidimicrobiaceae bacterium]|nr:DUF4193 family protein [Acidimicrobiaceae bacterium]
MARKKKSEETIDEVEEIGKGLDSLAEDHVFEDEDEDEETEGFGEEPDFISEEDFEEEEVEFDDDIDFGDDVDFVDVLEDDLVDDIDGVLVDDEVDDEEEDLESDDDESSLEDSSESDDDEDDFDDVDEDEVEASLDDILRERLVVIDDDDDDLEADDRGETITRVLPRQPDEFVCQSCFLVKKRSQLADPKRSFCRDCV